MHLSRVIVFIIISVGLIVLILRLRVVVGGVLKNE